MEWQPIETAPKDGTEILAFGLNRGKGPDFHIVVASWTSYGDFGFGWFEDESDLELAFLSHWAPLPPPPTAARTGADPAPGKMPGGM